MILSGVGSFLCGISTHSYVSTLLARWHSIGDMKDGVLTDRV